MAEPEWGQKRVCPKCSTRFYDLAKDPTTCPACEAVFALDALSERKSSPSRAKPKAKAAAPVAAAAVVAPAAADEDLIDSAEEEEEDLETEDDVLLPDDDEDSDDDLGEIGDVAAGTAATSDGGEEET
ncbi:MAG: TIGR02300 family protein [Pseudomonadota bacterium]